MINQINKNKNRKKRHERSRQNLIGTPERPRLNVYRSLNHIYAQVIDDIERNTIVSASTLDKELKDKLDSTSDKKAARLVGELVAKRAQEKGIKEVVFDRGGHIYHGRIKELADGAREAGLKF